MTIPLETWSLKNQWVLLRIDANVPLENGTILDDNRLQQVLPTIDYILEKKGRIIVLTHIGRPQDHEPSLSTKHLVSWFAKKYSIAFAATPADIPALQKGNANLILLENLRFFPEEKNLSLPFAQQLASYAQFYVNDAFGTLHRNHTSITLLAEQFPPNRKSMGFLVEKELNMLSALIDRHTHPTLIILGGAKLETKIPLIENLLDHTDTLFVGPALSCTFMEAQGISMGKSLVEHHLINECVRILEKAKKSSCKLIFPQDYLIAQDSIDGALSYAQTDSIPENGVCISIGEKTLSILEQYIKHATTIFLNGSMGFSDKPKTMEGMSAHLHMLNKATATTVIAGGDTVYYARSHDLIDHISYISTGGGATIQYLSGNELPGLSALKNGTESK